MLFNQGILPDMHIREGVSLADYSTMGLGGLANYLVEVTTEDELIEAISFAKEKALRIVTIGTGSNIVWTDDGFDGLVMVNKIEGIETVSETDQYVMIRGHSGVRWDDFVKHCTDLGLTGIEALSLIPGTCGAAPIQNIGAYGQEIGDTIHEVHAFDTVAEGLVSIEKADCQFSYRHSIFNTSAKGRYIVTGITVKLFKANPKPPYYRDVEAYLNEHDIIGPTPSQLREAVIAIRTIKLPNPSVVRNNGSFFHNPVVDPDTAKKLLSDYPELPNWEMNNGSFKLSAGWLIEQAGFYKDTHDEATGMATWKSQALVLVNENARSSSDLFAFRDRIIAAVKAKFGISLEQEPEVIR